MRVLVFENERNSRRYLIFNIIELAKYYQ